MEPLAAGDPVRVRDFVLRGRLGAGGMGEVFLGRSPGGMAVAVKVVHPHLAREAEFRHRFRREVASARAVGGAYTAPVVAAGPEDDPPWIATAYIPGPTLTDAVAKAGRFPVGSVWPLAAGLVEALQAIHAEGLLHRDLKPSNILLAADGPRVIDFGIARALDATVLTEPGKTVGTPSFMSPEQAAGSRVERPSDVFALGAVLAFAATGVKPFGGGGPLAVLYRVATAEPQLDKLTGPLRDLIAACLAKNPADRPTTTQLLREILTHWAPPDDIPPAPPRPQKLNPLIQTRAIPATTPHSPPTDVRGSDQPDALHARNQRAWKLGDAGEYAEAARLFAELAADRARLLGPDHPDAMRARQNHALFLGGAGEHAKAARLFAELEADQARVLGPDHPATVSTRELYAWQLGEAGGNAEAVRLFAELEAERVRVLGPDDHRVLFYRHLRALNLGEAGESVEAARLFAELAADRARLLGPDHPDAMRARHQRAWNLGEAGARAKAARLLARVVADRARNLGPDHPETLRSRQDHAWNLAGAGKRAKAARLFAELAADEARVLGPDHPATLLCRHLHAWSLGEAGEYVEAARLLDGVVADRARVLGPDHPDTLRSRQVHAWNLGKAEE
ncbi:hypothetical protein GCM10010400_12380 [Streptomyces aculeolatus]|uniref:serine/threonine-protein kinase n=1 Tax=Streptomyces aculeolatus TaxID=270689 RepID=UPI001CED835C|nr:tetratricopeptide repeat protein [Streptomyces aculeolatus]